jgi:hypothetical protein
LGILAEGSHSARLPYQSGIRQVSQTGVEIESFRLLFAIISAVQKGASGKIPWLVAWNICKRGSSVASLSWVALLMSASSGCLLSTQDGWPVPDLGISEWIQISKCGLLAGYCFHWCSVKWNAEFGQFHKITGERLFLWLLQVSANTCWLLKTSVAQCSVLLSTKYYNYGDLSILNLILLLKTSSLSKTMYCSVLLSGAAFLDGSILEIWKMNNSGVSVFHCVPSLICTMFKESD